MESGRSDRMCRSRRQGGEGIDRASVWDPPCHSSDVEVIIGWLRSWMRNSRGEFDHVRTNLVNVN